MAAEKPEDQWYEVSDFSPGVYTHVNTTGTFNRLLEAPKGAADAAGTYACVSLPDGGLGPWYELDHSYSYTPISGTTNYLVGFLVHDELANGDTEAFIVTEYDNGTNRHWQAYSYDITTNTFTLVQSTTEATSTGGIFGSPYPQFTRVNLTFVTGVTFTSGSPNISAASFAGVSDGDSISIWSVTSGTPSIPAETTVETITSTTGVLSVNATGSGTALVAFTSTVTPGNPVIVFPVGGPASPTDPQAGQVYLYPDPSNPTAYGTLALITGSGTNWSSVAGQILVHQNRIIDLAGITYSYPAGGGFDTNEQINFTDPPNSAVLGFQQTVVVPEEPYGFGAGGSISAGELFLVKRRGGGVVITGDIFAPNVTFLPGVQPTGTIYGQGCSGMAGFFYCSYAQGAWLWNGANTAQKISTQLEDNFFLPAEYFTGMKSNNYGFFIQSIGDKVYFSNNYLYDSRTNAWWKYYPDASQGGTNLYYVNPVSGPKIYAANLSFGSGADFMYEFDTATPAQHYQWTSMPTVLPVQDRVIDVREVVIKASCTAANCSVTLTILDKGAVVWGPTAQTGTLSQGPDYVRFNTAGLGCTAPQFRINVDNASAGDMGVVHDMRVRWRPRAHQAVTD